MRIRFITERLESEGWKLDDSKFQSVIATKDGVMLVAKNWNKLFFLIHKPKKNEHQ